MAMALTKPWDAAVEKNMRDFYVTLSEKDRRRFAAVQVVSEDQPRDSLAMAA